MKHASGPYAVIGITGRAGAGKDTCAEILVNSHAFATVAFADALRRELVQAFGVDIRLFTDRSTKNVPTDALSLGRACEPRFIDLMRALDHDIIRPRSPRDVMRLWGTAYRRAVDGENYWLARLHEAVEQLQREGWRRIAISDIRYPNEAAFSRELGASIWRIHRRIADDIPADHDSESQIDLIEPDYRLHNDGSLAAFVYDTLVTYEQHLFLKGTCPPSDPQGIFHATTANTAAR